MCKYETLPTKMNRKKKQENDRKTQRELILIPHIVYVIYSVSLHIVYRRLWCVYRIRTKPCKVYVWRMFATFSNGKYIDSSIPRYSSSFSLLHYFLLRQQRMTCLIVVNIYSAMWHIVGLFFPLLNSQIPKKKPFLLFFIIILKFAQHQQMNRMNAFSVRFYIARAHSFLECNI